MKNQSSQEEFKEEVEMLREQLKLEDIYILGLLRGFKRENLRAMMDEIPVVPVF